MPTETLIVRSDRVSEGLARCAGEALGAEVIRTGQHAAGHATFVLEIVNLEMALLLNDTPGLKSFDLDFNQVRRNNKKDALLRAIGTGVNTLVDMTPGWCGDALHIARQGIKVMAIERSKVVFLMISHARKGLSDASLKARLVLFHGQSERWLEAEDYRPDVIYLDPIFPEKSKSAATRKDRVILQRLSRQDSCDNADNERILFDTAIRHAQKRVVVKRPHYAAPLAPGRVGETRSKLIRFDIYRPNSL